MLLSVGVGRGEGRVGAGRFVGAAKGRIVGDRDREAPGIIELRHQANVSDGRAVPEQEGAGAGLGLAMARTIAEAHGGRLELSRSDGSGSLFVAVLPRGEG